MKKQIFSSSTSFVYVQCFWFKCMFECFDFFFFNFKWPECQIFRRTYMLLLCQDDTTMLQFKNRIIIYSRIYHSRFDSDFSFINLDAKWVRLFISHVINTSILFVFLFHQIFCTSWNEYHRLFFDKLTISVNFNIWSGQFIFFSAFCFLLFCLFQLELLDIFFLSNRY